MTNQKLEDLVATLVITQQRNEEQFSKNNALLTKALAKTDAQLAKTDIQLAETSAEIKSLGKAMKEHSAETKAEIMSLGKRMKELSEMYGGASNNQGDVAEEFYFNSLAETRTLNGIHFDYIDKNVSRSTDGLRGEYDIVMINGSDILIIEVKYKVMDKHIKHLLNVQQPKFHKLFPQYHKYKQHWGLATFHISDELKNAALEQGINVLQRKGDVIETLSA